MAVTGEDEAAGLRRLLPRRGLLGPYGPDEFPVFDGWQPPVRRSEVEPFTEIDALVLLDGDGSPSGHGYHRHGLGIKDSEFPLGWGPVEVIEWVRDIIDHPVWGEPSPDGSVFWLIGWEKGVRGLVVIRYRDRRWFIATAYPVAIGWEI